MALTTYVAGDVLTASSLNDNFTFAAANPPAAASGLAFISSTTFTAATSFSLPADTFTATFDNYRIMISVDTVVSAASFTGRLRAAGSDNTTANYQTAFLGLTTGGDASNEIGISQTSFKLGESGTEERSAYSLDIFQPFLSLNTEIVGGYTCRNLANTGSIMRTGGAQFTLTTSFDSFTFISSVASNMTGTVRAYGYAQ